MSPKSSSCLVVTFPSFSICSRWRKVMAASPLLVEVGEQRVENRHKPFPSAISVSLAWTVSWEIVGLGDTRRGEKAVG